MIKCLPSNSALSCRSLSASSLAANSVREKIEFTAFSTRLIKIRQYRTK